MKKTTKTPDPMTHAIRVAEGVRRAAERVQAVMRMPTRTAAEVAAQVEAMAETDRMVEALKRMSARTPGRPPR